MNPEFPISPAPSCSRCGARCSRHIVSVYNQNGNAGRPYYTCFDGHARAFRTWDDDVGVEPGNPTCACGLRARRNTRHDGHQWYCCPVGSCWWTEQVEEVDDTPNTPVQLLTPPASVVVTLTPSVKEGSDTSSFGSDDSGTIPAPLSPESGATLIGGLLSAGSNDPGPVGAQEATQSSSHTLSITSENHASQTLDVPAQPQPLRPVQSTQSSTSDTLSIGNSSHTARANTGSGGSFVSVSKSAEQVGADGPGHHAPTERTGPAFMMEETYTRKRHRYCCVVM